jgi:hypothetical protein
MTALAKFYMDNMRALDNPATYGYNGQSKGLGASRIVQLVATDPYAQDQSGFTLGEWFGFYVPPCSPCSLTSLALAMPLTPALPLSLASHSPPREDVRVYSE